MNFAKQSVFGCDPNLTTIYRPADNCEQRGTILAFHGGAFVGDSAEWDREQNSLLAAMGFHVHQLEFPKSTEMFEKWLSSDEMLEFLDQQSTSFGPLFVLGRSSGGYLASWFRARHAHLIARTIYVCPVFCPLERARLLPQFAAQTQQFFGEQNSPPHSVPALLDPKSERLFIAENDADVPRICFSPEQLDCAIQLDGLTHSQATQCCDLRFLRLVDDFFTSK